MTYRYLLFILLLVWGHTALAQREYKPGYIVKPSGDTLRGLIRYVENHQQALSCCYRPDMKAPVVCYQPTELQGYGFDTGRIFKSILFEGEPIFMQVLAAGNATLLKHNQQYYARKENEKLYALVVQDTLIYRSGRPFFAKNRLFATLLQGMIMYDCPAVQPLLARAALRDIDLIQVFEVYNNCRPNETSTLVPPLTVNSRIHISFGAGISWSMSSLGLEKTRLVPIQANLHPNSLVVPHPGLWVIVHTPRISERFAVQTGLHYVQEAFSHATSDISDEQGYTYASHQDLWIQLQSIRVPFMLRYQLPGNKIIPYLSAGASLLVPLRNESKYTVERQAGQVINSYQYPFLNTTSVVTGFVAAIGLKLPISNKLSAFCEGRFERAVNGIAKTTYFSQDKYPHAAGMKSIDKASYQAVQVSFGLLFR